MGGSWLYGPGGRRVTNTRNIEASRLCVCKQQGDSLLSSSNKLPTSGGSSGTEKASSDDNYKKAGEGLSSAEGAAPHIVSSVSSVAAPVDPADDISPQGTTRQDGSQTKSTSGKTKVNKGSLERLGYFTTY